MRKKEYEAKVLELLKQVRQLTNEYCGCVCSYMNVTIFPNSISFNNRYWQGVEPYINVRIENEEEDENE